MTLRSTNETTNRREVSAGALVLDSMPTMLYVELTQNCNLHCRMCRSALQYSPQLNMPAEVFERVMSEVAPFASMIDLRGWGESTILKDFPSRTARAADTGARLRLITNGINLGDESWHTILKTDGVVGVSVDACTQSVASLLGRGDMERVLASVRRGVAIRDRCRKGTIYFNTVVSIDTLGEIAAIVKTAGSLGVDKVVLTPVKTHPNDPSSLLGAADRVGALLDEVAVVSATACVPVQLGAALHPSFADSRALPSVCANPWTDAVVAFNGDIIFCDHLIGQHEYSTGNLLKTGFRDIWNGPRFVALRQAHLKAKDTREVGRFEKCTWCYANRYADSEGSPSVEQRERVVWVGTSRSSQTVPVAT